MKYIIYEMGRYSQKYFQNAVVLAMISVIVIEMIYLMFQRKRSIMIVISEMLLFIYTYLLVLSTIVNRVGKHINGLSDLWGGWTVDVLKNGTVKYESIENVILFIPFSFLLCILLCLEKNRRCYKIGIFSSALVSFGVETLQLGFSLGTFQISDLVYNIFGGVIGAALAMGIERIFQRVCRKKIKEDAA